MSSLDYNCEDSTKKQDAKRKREIAERAAFLNAARAIPMPAELYAIWLELYLRQGGAIHSTRSYNFRQTVGVRSDIHANSWVATQDGGIIPENYGSAALTLLVFPDITGQSITKATNDVRAGWEWGHSKVLSITKDNQSQTGFNAWTNSPYRVDTYADVEKIRRGMNLGAMMAKYGIIVSDMMKIGEFARLFEEQQKRESSGEALKAWVNSPTDTMEEAAAYFNAHK